MQRLTPGDTVLAEYKNTGTEYEAVFRCPIDDRLIICEWLTGPDEGDYVLLDWKDLQ